MFIIKKLLEENHDLKEQNKVMKSHIAFCHDAIEQYKQITDEAVEGFRKATEKNIRLKKILADNHIQIIDLEDNDGHYEN